MRLPASRRPNGGLASIRETRAAMHCTASLFRQQVPLYFCLKSTRLGKLTYKSGVITRRRRERNAESKEIGIEQTTRLGECFTRWPESAALGVDTRLMCEVRCGEVVLLQRLHAGERLWTGRERPSI